MSTTINVTVGGNGLLDQSRQQMQANRFGKLERDRDQQVEQEAIENKPAEAPTGRPRQTSRINQEPAAFRGGLPHVLLVPDGPADGRVITARSRNHSPVAFRLDNTFFQGNEVIYESPAPLYDASGGPAGTSAFYLPTEGPELFGILQRAEYTLRTSKSRFKEYTVEAFFRAGDGRTPDVETSLNQHDIKLVMLPGFSIHLSFSGNFSFSDSRSYGAYDLEFESEDGASYGIEYSDYGDAPMLVHGKWYHVAAVASSDAVAFYFDGQQVQSSPRAQSPAYPGLGLGEDTVGGYFELFGRGSEQRIRPAIHGIRYTPRALYTSSFTPPASITSFA